MIFKSNRRSVSERKDSIFKIGLAFLFIFTLGFPQDPPEHFEFEISIYQSFYFFLESDIDGTNLDPQNDWIASFNVFDETNGGICNYINQDLDNNSETAECEDLNNDGNLTVDAEICVGSYYWDGPYTTVPVMGNDGTRWTKGYMEESELPIFKIYDASENITYSAVPSVIYPWTPDLNFYVISISVLRDCDDSLGGSALIDDCGNCSLGDTGLEYNYEDLGCGCYEPAPIAYYEDNDGDNLGWGEAVYFCEHPGLGWSDNNYDNYPDCFDNFYDCNNECGGNAFLDDCNVCSGGSSNHLANSDFDCNGVCFGTAFYDECDDCVGGDTELSPCDFISEQPVEFYFYQSTLQAFYFIIDAYIGDGDNLASQDWIGVFNNDVCVGSVKYDGPYTTVPAMGDDGSDWTGGYLEIGDFPTFKLWDASQNLFYPVEVDILKVETNETFPYTGWFPNDYFNVIDFHALIVDCSGVLDGGAYFDNCGDCVGGITGIAPDLGMDCNNDCYGDAYIDNCGVCVGGETELEPNLDDLGCGCFLSPPDEYYSDFDNDGYGYGDSQGFCDNPGDGWIDNNIDPEPYCPNPDLNTSLIDDCGVCQGGNNDQDCSGVCFGGAILDDCGVCQGNNSTCNSPISNDIYYEINEDESLEIDLVAVDPNNAPLTFIIIDNPENGSLSGDSPNFIYTPNNDFFGEDLFTYQAYNGQYYSETSTVTIDVENQNDAPIVESLNINLDEDSFVIFELSGLDVDGDQIDFSIASNPSNGTIDISDNEVSYYPFGDYNGLDQFSVLGFDGQDYSEESLIVLTINSVNDAPIVEEVESTQINQDTTFEIAIAGSDIDSEILFYSVSVDGNASASVLDGQLRVTPFSGFNGIIEVTVFVSDGYLSDDTSFNLEVIAVNDPPVLSFIGSQIVNEDQDLVIDLNATDPEDDSLTYSYDITNGSGSLDESVLTITPDLNFNGDMNLTVTVSDGELDDSEVFTVSVIPVNDPPYFITESINTAKENQEYVQIIEYADVDNDVSELSLELNNSLGWLSVDGDTMMGVPSFSSGGNYSVILILSDDDTSISIEYDITVEESNQPPLVSDMDIAVEEDSSVNFTLLSIDAEGDDVTYSYTTPSYGHITGQAPNLIYTPDLNFNGDDLFTYIASDGSSDSDTANVSISIISVNDIPIAESIDFNVIGQSLTFDISNYTSDEDNDLLSFNTVPPSDSNTFSTLMGGSIEYISNYQFRYIKPESDIAADYAIYKVSDDFSDSSVEIITFIIDDERSSNRLAPSALDDNVSIMEDTESNISLFGFDIFGFPQNGDAQIEIVQAPQNGVITEPSFELSSTSQLAQWVIAYTPDNNFSGNDEIKYRVLNPNNNLGQSEEGTISILITEVNDSPILNSISDESINEDEPLSQIITAFDLDDSISLSASSSIAGFNFEFEAINDTESSLVIIPPQNYNGLATITVSASEEGGDLSVSESFNLNVLPVNDSPNLSFIDNKVINEDDFILINLSASDIDYNNLSFSANSDSEDIEIVLNNNLLILSGSENYFGNGEISVTVNDGEGGVDSQIFMITINPINDPPIIDDLEFSQNEDTSINIYPEGNDIEGSALEFLYEDPSNGILSLFDSTLIYTPDPNFNGLDSFTYRAFDGEDYSDTATITININSINDPPTIDSIPDHVIEEGSNFLYVLNSNDIDGDILSYSYQINEEIDASINGNLLTISFDLDYNGEIQVEAFVSDGEYVDSDSFRIIVTPVNDSPVVQNPLSDLILNEDFNEYRIDISNTFEDVDLDSLQYSYSIDNSDIIDISLIETDLILNSIQDISGGPLNVTLTADDLSRRVTISDHFEIIVEPENDAPIAYDIVLEINEDAPEIVLPDFIDVDTGNSSIELSIVTNPSHGSLDIQGQGFIYSPNLNFSGVDFFTYKIYDGYTYSNSANAFVYVLPSNDPPQILDIETQQIDEDSSLQVEIPAIDIDQDVLAFEATSNNSQTYFDGNNLTVVPDLNFNGEISVIISISDGEYYDSTELIIDVLPSNDPPEIFDIDSQQIDEDSILNISLNGIDVDGDQLSYSIESDIDSEITLLGNLLSVVPPLNFNGSIQIIASVTDGDLSDSTAFNINVLGVNDSPVLAENQDQSMFEDSTLEFNILASDIDGDQLSFGAFLEDDSNAVLSIIGDMITVVPNADWYGELVIDITVQDIEGLEDSQSLIINVIPVNDLPTIISVPILTALEDQEYQYQLEFYDPDNSDFYYYFLLYPDGMEMNEDGLITWTPTEGVLSSGYVSVVVWDTDNPQSGADYPGLQEFQISVTPVNDPPSIISTPLSNAIEDEEYIYQVDVTDIDSEYFLFTLEDAPEGMEIQHGQISWTPLEGVLTSGLFTVYAYDNEGEESLFDTQSYAISVTPVNDPPSIISTAPSEVMEQGLYEYQIQIDDPDDDEFTFQLINAPEGMSINFSTNILTWTPQTGGIYGPITLKVFDGGENFSEPAIEIFTIDVDYLTDFITMEFDLHEDNNLISFLGIPDNPDISVILNPLSSNANQVITEGLAATNSGNFGWVGSLDEFESSKGYWIGLDSSAVFTVEALPTNQDLVYNIHDGYNLISYIGTNGALLDDAFPDFMEDDISDVLTEGMAATRHPEFGWVGSLATVGFEHLRGYWLKNITDDNIEFSWNTIDGSLTSNRRSESLVVKYKETPKEFKVSQSSQQAFYFFENIISDGYEINEGDWILAFNKNKLVGSRRWMGAYTDVPVMGYDGSPNTLGYCDISDIPTFKIFNFKNGAIIDVEGSFPAWSNLATHLIDSISGNSIPAEFNLDPAYPNPFNPITHIGYSVPHETAVSITVYDLMGREVSKLIDSMKEPGYYDIEWDASSFASGMYFITMKTSDFESSQKIVLIK